MTKALEMAQYANQSFALPETCNKIRSLLDDPNGDSDDIGEVIALDPSLSSKLLKLANSSLFRFPAQINSISKAVSIIGGEALYNLALAEVATSAFMHFESEAIDLKRFWRQSVYAGVVAKQLARMARSRGSDEYFVIGLLHQLSELVVSQKEPIKADEVQQFVKGKMPWDRQKAILGFTYAECSALILEHWQLPSQFSYTISHLHDPVKAGDSNDVAIAHLAVRVALHMIDDRYELNEVAEPEVLSKLDLELVQVKDAIRYGRLDAESMLAVMNPGLFK